MDWMARLELIASELAGVAEGIYNTGNFDTSSRVARLSLEIDEILEYVRSH